MDEPRFEDVVARHGKHIDRMLWRCGVPARDLEDVKQEVLRGVHRGLGSFDPSRAKEPEAALRNWLSQICRKQSAYYHRARRGAHAVLCEVDALDQRESRSLNAEQRRLAAEREALLAELLLRTNADRRAVIVAYNLEEATMEQVASMLGIPVNTAWNRLRLGLLDLRAAWERRRAAEATSGAVSV